VGIVIVGYRDQRASSLQGIITTGNREAVFIVITGHRHCRVCRVGIMHLWASSSQVIIIAGHHHCMASSLQNIVMIEYNESRGIVIAGHRHLLLHLSARGTHMYDSCNCNLGINYTCLESVVGRR